MGWFCFMESTNERNQRTAQLRGFLAIDPANVPLACDLFDALVEVGDIGQAVTLLETLPQQAQADAAIRFRLARAGLMQGRYADAAQWLGSLIGEGHANAALWHDLAFAQLCLRDTQAARATLADAQERFGDDVELDVLAARVAMMDEDFPQALERLDRALARTPAHATAQGVRSLALLDQGDTEAGYAAAMACLAAHPAGQHEALLVAGTVALWRRALDESETHFANALAQHPNSGRCLSGLGQTRMQQRRLGEARALLRDATEAMPDHIGTWHALAWVDLLEGEIDAAEASYQRAYDLDRNFADSHGGLALIHVLRGRNDEAELAIRRALRLNPQCPTALYAQTLLLDAEGRGDEALRLLGNLVQPADLPEGMELAELSRLLRERFKVDAR